MPLSARVIPHSSSEICQPFFENAGIVAAGENGNDLNYFGLYLNKSVMVIIIKIYDRDRFLGIPVFLEGTI
jgi:hypothetical protein